MGRSELPVDPTRGPLQRFAADLQSLRRDAGEPTYRSMGRAAGMSPSVLSQAAKGNRLPTLQATLAFVRACGVDGTAELRWRERWERVREEMVREPVGRPAPEADPSEQPSAAPVSSRPPEDLRTEEAGTTPRRLRLRPRPVALAAGAALLLINAGWAASSTLAAFSSTRPPARTGAGHPVEDGQDPYVEGCGHDQRPMERQPIYRADGTSYGWIVLFVSPSCSAAWGYVLGPNSPRWRVHISAHRLDDGTEAPSSFRGQARPNSWGNVLSTRTGCVRAEAWVDDGPRAITSCWRHNGPIEGGAAR